MSAFSTAAWTSMVALAVGSLAGVVMVFTGILKSLDRKAPRQVRSAVPARAEPGDSRLPREAAVRAPGSNASLQNAFGRDDAGSRASVDAPSRSAMPAVGAPAIAPSASRPAPRRLDHAGIALMVWRLSRFAGIELDIYAGAGEIAGADEAPALADDLCRVLASAGWNVRMATSADQKMSGVGVQTRRGAGHTVQEPAIELMLVLRELGVAARAIGPFDPSSATDGESGTTPLKQPAPIRLIVGDQPWRQVRAAG